jgi:hypothetical protein
MTNEPFLLLSFIFPRRFQTAGSYEVVGAWNGSLHKASSARNISPRFEVGRRENLNFSFLEDNNGLDEERIKTFGP